MKTISNYKIIILIIGLGNFAFAVTEQGARCSLVVPLAGKNKILQQKESKILNCNLKNGVAGLATLFQDLRIFPKQVRWRVPNSILSSCNILLPVSSNQDFGIKVISNTDREALIILNDIGILSESSVGEVTSYFKKINKYKQLFDPRTISIPCWITGFVVIHKKNDTRLLSDNVSISLKIASQDNELTRIIAGLDDCLERYLGIPKKIKSVSIPLAAITSLDRSTAHRLVERLRELTHSFKFNKKPFRLRGFYIKQFSRLGSTLHGPCEIRNFAHI